MKATGTGEQSNFRHVVFDVRHDRKVLLGALCDSLQTHPLPDRPTDRPTPPTSASPVAVGVPPCMIIRYKYAQMHSVLTSSATPCLIDLNAKAVGISRVEGKEPCNIYDFFCKF